MNINKLVFACAILISSFVSSSAIYASEDSNDESIEQKLSSLKLEKMQAESMIAKMAKSGRLNSDEVSRAKREIASVQEEDMEQIKARAIERLSSKNSFATK